MSKKGLFGVDCSHWQGAISWKNVKTDFAILKCSEGVKFIDPMFNQNKIGCRRNLIPLGYYHFAKGGDAKKEARFFVRSVNDIGVGEFLVLDYEIQLASPAKWCKTFLDEVTRLVGFKPLIYLNSSTAKRYDWSEVIKGDYGLWIANYGLNLPVVGFKPPAIGMWPFYAIWQYSSRGKILGIKGNVDLNWTKCDLQTLRKYGKP
jgi:lysozyme